MLQTVVITVKGKVQGVFFRQSTKDTALQLGIKGEVKNLDNGDVQVTASGTEEQLRELVAWCRQGPKRAVVMDVIVETIPLQSFSSFTIAR